ncbi:MAG TPA: hypothetical protein VF646_12590 [Cytophagales bacterium]|jgi:hypothetical protein
MQCTTTRSNGLYFFRMLDGRTLRTSFSPREISGYGLFAALDERGNVKVVLTEQVDFASFRYGRVA